MIDYDELDGIVGCYCTLVYPYRGHSEGTVVADYGQEIIVRLNNGGAPDKPCGVGRADANPKLLLNDT